MPPAFASVVIAGGGPCGLMLAIELGRRGIDAVVLDEKPGTAFNPQANATQARTMEHYRRLGFADEVRAQGLPPDYPTDIAYYTRFARHELARFRLPSAREARERVSALIGPWTAAELPHRVAQKYVEAVLRRHAESLPGIALHYGWRVTDFASPQAGVKVEAESVDGKQRASVHGAYLVGADGPRSFVRQRLGIRYEGDAGLVRDFMGGTMAAVYLRAPGFYRTVPHAPAWMNVTINRERRALLAAVDGRGEFAFHTQLRPDEGDCPTPAQGRAMFESAVGAPLEAEVLSCSTWTAGHALVAERFQADRVFLGGDAAHLFTPPGGLGYNTAVEDAVNLGWKLAAVLRGWGGPGLLASYEAERRPLAVRNTGYSRRFSDSLGLYPVPSEIEDDTEAGVAARRHAGAYYDAHARAEFDIPGITLGGRYDGSPVIASDETSPPPDSPNVYIPSACPGGRPPHAWLADGRSLFDTFGFEWTLLRLGPEAADGAPLVRAAGRAGIPLQVVSLPDAGLRELYQADLALIRPDQIVAWRGSRASPDAERLLRRVNGFPAVSPP